MISCGTAVRQVSIAGHLRALDCCLAHSRCIVKELGKNVNEISQQCSETVGGMTAIYVDIDGCILYSFKSRSALLYNSTVNKVTDRCKLKC